MTDSTDYEDILEGTVEEAKDAIRDLENPDYEELLEAEIEGKNRKTLRSWLEDEIEEKGYEEAEEEVKEEMFSTSLSTNTAIVGGLVVGLVAGLLLGSFVPLSSSGGEASPSQVQDSVRQLITAGGFNGTVEVDRPTMEHGLYYVNATFTQEGENGTVSQSQQFYVTSDGELLIPIRTNPLTGQMMTPVPIQQRLDQIQQQQAAPQEPSANTTS